MPKPVASDWLRGLGRGGVGEWLQSMSWGQLLIRCPLETILILGSIRVQIIFRSQVAWDLYAWNNDERELQQLVGILKLFLK